MTLGSLAQYGTGFQTKVIACLLNDKKFLQTIHDILSDEYFDNSSHKWLIQQTLKYYQEYHTVPSLEYFQVEVKKIENEILKVSLVEQLRECYRTFEAAEDIEYVEKEFATFCKNQQLKNALFSSVEMLNMGDYDSIRFLIDSALKAGQDKNIGHEYVKDIESRYRNEHRSVIPTPFERFNELLQNGLGNGDLGIVFGSPGGGKSWCLIAMGAHAVELGFNVVHYTLELGEGYVGKRYDAYFSGISVAEVHNHRDQVQTAIDALPGKLIIKEYAPRKASISTIESHLQKCSDSEMKPDLVIIDYVDLLSSFRKNKERKDEIDDIYISTKSLARQLNIPVWTASQVNRAGAKDDIIEGDKAAGSYDKLMIADVAISLSRKRQDKVSGLGRFHIMKNRYGMDGLTFNTKIDTTTGHFDILGENFEEDEPQQKQSAYSNQIDSVDKSMLSQRFFELNPTNY
jgi:replicative DNA helicase